MSSQRLIKFNKVLIEIKVESLKKLLGKWLNLNEQQECIPVGFVPPAAVAASCGGSASVHTGIHPQVWAWSPSSVVLEPPGCEPGDTPLGCGQTPQLPPWVWAWKALETCKACWATTPPVDRQTRVKT